VNHVTPEGLQRRASGRGGQRLTSDDALAAAVEAICAHEAVERSWAVAQEWVDDALRALERVCVPPPRSSRSCPGNRDHFSGAFIPHSQERR
jgi:hypothetical protein